MACIRISSAAFVLLLLSTFVFAQTPTITSFTPVKGLVGSTVTITGTNFSPTPANNVVFFGATQATVNTASATTLTVIVPGGATYNPITVFTNGRTAFSRLPFAVTFNGDGGGITSGTFPAPTSPSYFSMSTGETYNVSAADLNADGKADLIFGGSYDGGISVLRNTSALGSISFAPIVNYETGGAGFSTSIGDIDGDGKPDVVVAHESPSSVSVMINTSTTGGAITFAAYAEFFTASSSPTVQVRDFDGDGKPDLLALGSNVFSIFRNTTTGGSVSFATRIDITTLANGNPYGVNTADLDGDNKPDVAVPIYGSNVVSTYRNTSTGAGVISFAAKVDFTTGTGPQTVEVGDFDGDNKADLAVGCQSVTSILRNTSASIGSIAFAAKSDIGASDTFSLGDVDGDGKQDIASGLDGSTTVYLYRNTSTGAGNIGFSAGVAFQQAAVGYSVSTTIGDLDGDNKPDLFVANASVHFISVFRNLTKTPHTITSFTPASGPVASTVTITGTNFSAVASNNVVFFGATKATVQTATTTSLVVKVPVGATFEPISVVINGSIAYTKTPFLVTFPNGAGLTASSFTSNVDFTTGAHPNFVGHRDLDGDGKADLVVVNRDDNNISVYPNSSTGPGVFTFGTKVTITTAVTPRFVGFGDLDADGKPDLAVACDGYISVLRNTTSGPGAAITFAAKADITAGANLVSVAITDLDYDGKADLIFIDGTYVSVLKNKTIGAGSISFATRMNIAPGDYDGVIATGDFDNDGKIDLISSLGSDIISVIRNTSTAVGTLSFAGPVDVPGTSSSYRFTALADFDADGKQDLATTFYYDGIIMFRNTSSGAGSISTTNAGNFQIGSFGEQFMISDLDGDGKPDIAIGSEAALGISSMKLIRNSSTGAGNINFEAAIPLTVGSDSYSASVGDLDGDGKPEVVVTSLADKISVFRRQVVPSAPVATTATSITQTSFVANWSASAGATTHYFLDVATNAGFTAFVPGYNNFDVTSGGLSATVSGLSKGISYYYRVRATDVVPVSASSNTITVLTAPTEPVSSAATLMTQTSFSANWAATASATNYSLDVAMDVGFGTPVAGSPFSTGNVLTKSIAGLTGGTTYYYRVRAVNAGGTSGNSGTQSALTIPANPATNPPTGFTQTSFLANWTAPSSATAYSLDVATDAAFASPISGSPFSVATNSRSITGLTAGATYYYRVRASNASGISGNSSSTSAITQPANPVLSAATLIASNTFTINWNSILGASSFLVDISSDNFTDFIPGYNALSVAGPTTYRPPATLASGTTFQVRIRSNNASGASGYSNVINVTTLASEPGSQPNTLTFPAVSTSSMTGIFTANGTPSGYLVLYKSGSSPTEIPVDGAEYVLGNGLGSSTIGYVGNSNSFTINGLSAATTYFFDIFAFNGTTGRYNYLTTSPLEGSRATLSLEPALQPTTLQFGTITASSIAGSFTAAVGSPSGYIVVAKKGSAPATAPVDGTSYNPGTLGDGEVVSTGSTTAFTHASLDPNTTYFYSIYSYSGSGAGINYLTISPLSNSALTLPPAPVAVAATNNTAASFDANWNAVSGGGTITYDLDVSMSETFTSVLQNFQVVNTFTQRITGLTASTDYFYRVRAKNATGFSQVYSSTINARTSDTGGSGPLTVGSPVANYVAASFTEAPVSTSVTGGTGTKTVTLRYRAIAANTTTFESLPATDEGSNNFGATVPKSAFDELGLEYFFEATDQGTGTASGNHSYLYRSVDAAGSAIPFKGNKFDGSASTYEMFSVPYELTDRTVATVFVNQGGADKTKWRLFHYQGDRYIEYPDNITNIELGKGYWFNTTDKTEIKAGAGKVDASNQDNEFTMAVEFGWNQIGNPYPFNLTWEQVKIDNTTVGLNSLWLFENGAYVKKDVFAAWRGAFVYADNAGTITIPILAKTTQPGRIAKNPLRPAIDEPSWLLPLKLELNGLAQTSGIGMDPQAKSSKDGFDEPTMPRFIDFLEMDTYHEEFHAQHFATDVVPSALDKSWVFTVSSNQKSGQALISWDQSALANSLSSIVLIDLSDGVIVDMKTQGHYSFAWSEGRQFKVIFSKEGDIRPGVTLLGAAFPNPFTTSISIPVLLEHDQSLIQIDVYDLVGRKVKTITRDAPKAGVHEIVWDGRNDLGNQIDAGLYLYQLKGDKGVLSVPKRLIKN